MCFYVNMNDPDRKIAEEDIIVYKILSEVHGGWGYSPYRTSTLWQRGGSLESRIMFEHNGLIISEGLHAYLTYRAAKYGLPCFPSRGESINKFIIPKGSVYYTNENNEVVTNRMMWASRSYLFKRAFNRLFN